MKKLILCFTLLLSTNLFSQAIQDLVTSQGTEGGGGGNDNTRCYIMENSERDNLFLYSLIVPINVQFDSIGFSGITPSGDTNDYRSAQMALESLIIGGICEDVLAVL